MSRTSAAYLNVPLMQLEKLKSVKAVFERNTRVQIDNALRFINPTPDIVYLAELTKVAAAEVVATYGDEEKHEAVKGDFVYILHSLKSAILSLKDNPTSAKRREIATLGV